MKGAWIFACLLLAVHGQGDFQKPLYKYRYETKDMMKTASSNVPVHGYHVVEGGYYPVEADYGFEGGDFGLGGAGFDGAGFGGAGFGGAGYGGPFLGGKFGYGGDLGYGDGFVAGPAPAAPGYGFGPIGYGGVGGNGGYGGVGANGGLGGAGYGGADIGGGHLGGGGVGFGAGGGPYVAVAPVVHHGPTGGQVVEKKAYSEGKKKLNDESFEKAHGSKGETFHHGQEGYSAGKAVAKDVKVDSGYYNEQEGGKKLFEDEKAYHGAKKYNHEGHAKGEKKVQQGHKKGHFVKGFKTSHHKDESGKTEEYYDEENDEGNHFDFNTQGGSFAENSGEHYKGGHEDGKFNAGEAKKEGHYKKEHFIDHSNGGHGDFGEKKYAAHDSTYGVNNGVDAHSLSGHHESEGFYNHHPDEHYY